MSSFHARTVVVTGAATGIGRAIAERFAQAGASLVLVDLDDDGLQELARALGGTPGAAAEVELVTGDVADEPTAQAAIARAETRFGRLDVLINNAYAAVDGSALDLRADGWRRTLDVCLTGMFHFVHHALPAMLRRGGGNIVNLSSVNAALGTPGLAAYAAAKGGVSAFTRQLAVEYGPRGLRTNAIAPGLIATEAVKRRVLSDPSEAQAASEACPLRRAGRSDEIASVAFFLASDEAGYINGQVLTVDGGTSVQWPMALVRPGLRDRAGLPPIARHEDAGEPPV